MTMFAHSVRNPEIKHYFIRQSRNVFAPDGTRKRKQHRWLAYLCIRASSTTPSKRTRVVSEVTCLNCLRELRRRAGR